MSFTGIEHVFGGTLRSTRSVSVQSSPTSVQLPLGAASAIVLTNTSLSETPIGVRLPPEAQSAGSQVWLQCGAGSSAAIEVQGATGTVQVLPAGASAFYICDGNAWYAMGGLEPQGALLRYSVTLEAGETLTSIEVPSTRVSATGAILVTLEAPAGVTVAEGCSISSRDPGASFTVRLNVTNTGLIPTTIQINASVA
jgi:hypothetical protein